MKKQCDQCLFTDNKIVSNERRKDLIKEITSKQSYFECHKASIAGQNHCCRGYYDQLGHHSQQIRIAERLGCVAFEDLDEQQP